MMKSNAMAGWFANGFMVIGLGLIGYAVYGAMQPGATQSNTIEVEITDHAVLKDRVAGSPIRIPVVAVNKTATRIRLVGTNAC